ncbi:MAG: membrane dipeptidase, partial [Myxococcota bacterium]
MAPGVEGAHMLDGDMGHFEALAARAPAYMTLAHFSKNSAATPSLGRGANEVEGLTGFGRELVSELERHGIFVDVAHVNTPGVLDVCA